MNLVLPKCHCLQDGYLDYLAQIDLIPCLLLNPVALSLAIYFSTIPSVIRIYTGLTLPTPQTVNSWGWEPCFVAPVAPELSA